MSLYLIEGVPLRFPVGGLFLLHFLAQDHGAWSLSVIRESFVSVNWERGPVLVVSLLVVRLVWSLRFSSVCFSARSSSSLSSVACAQEHACILLSFLLPPLDDLTMPPYSPLPPPPMTPLSGNVNTFLAESKCLALARFDFLTLLFLLLFFLSCSQEIQIRVTGHSHHTAPS